MGEVSNKTIVALLTVALVITVVGTVVSVSKLSGLGGRYTLLTGAATDTGTTTLNISSTIGFTMTDSAMDFGAIIYNTSCSISTNPYGNITSDGGTDTCLLNSSGNGVQSVDDPHIIQNSGNTNVNITAAIDSNAGQFICGGVSNNCPATDSAMIYILAADKSGESGACQTGYLADYAQIADETTTNEMTLCDRLIPNDGTDEMEVNLKLSIPYDVFGGKRTATITYTATSTT